MKTTLTDEKWMGEALRLARRGLGGTRPNPPVGAVVVRNGRCVGKGFHRKAGGPHAEVIALAAAGRRARNGTLYVTLEPCCTQGRTPPCTGAILRAGVRRVVVSVPDPNPKHNGRGMAILRRAGCIVAVGAKAIEGHALAAPFSKWITSGMPYVTLKLAMTIDGRIADHTGRSRWISSARSRACVHRMRRRVDAVLVGADTVREDNPRLLARGPSGYSLLRVIVDSRRGLPPGSRVLSDTLATRTIVATTRLCPPARRKEYSRHGASVLQFPAGTGGGVRLKSLLAALGRMGVLHVLCEGGGRMAASLMEEGLVDEFVFFLAPRVLAGGYSVSPLSGKGWHLGTCPRLRFTGCRRAGDDVVVTAVPLAAYGGKGRGRMPSAGSSCSRD